MAGAALDTERVHEPLEGHFLVREGASSVVARTWSSRAEKEAAGSTRRAQHERVEKQADDVLGGRVGAAGGGRADAEVRPGRSSGESSAVKAA